MKIFLYTISNFAEQAINCIDLLFTSINFDISTDFSIISNQHYNSKYNIIIDETLPSNEYIGCLKYSSMIPDYYDYYIYLDSDILYFDKISKLIDYNKVFTITKEQHLINNSPWHLFPYVENQEEKILLQKCQALNAGSFGFHKSQLYILQKISDLYLKFYSKNNINYNAMLEQSIYNYIVYSSNNFKTDLLYDITDMVELFAASKSRIPNKTLYHFCYFTNEMSTKYKNMEKFYNEYNQ